MSKHVIKLNSGSVYGGSAGTMANKISMSFSTARDGFNTTVEGSERDIDFHCAMKLQTVIISAEGSVEVHAAQNDREVKMTFSLSSGAGRLQASKGEGKGGDRAAPY